MGAMEAMENGLLFQYLFQVSKVPAILISLHCSSSHSFTVHATFLIICRGLDFHGRNFLLGIATLKQDLFPRAFMAQLRTENP